MDDFVRDIKHNCDVSDASYWGYFTICGLLLRYLDLYRSERGLKLHQDVNREEIAAWIEEKEARWPELESKSYRDIEIAGKGYNPFDLDGINAELEKIGLVYGAGYGMYMKATFFLAEIKSSYIVEGHRVYIAGREMARDLLTSPAMLQGRTIYIRTEPLKSLLWDKFISARGKACDAVCDAFSYYGIGFDEQPASAEEKIESIAERYSIVLEQHEMAEYSEDAPGWRDMLAVVKDRTIELYLRAVKDIVADTSSRGPLAFIVSKRDAGLLSLFVALREGFIPYLFPELKKAYASFLKSGDWTDIEAARAAGYSRYTGMRNDIMLAYSKKKDDNDFSREIMRSIDLLRGLRNKQHML